MAGRTTVQIDDLTLSEGAVIQERYRLGAPLGSGGFAKVFEAFDINIERSVAIKFLDLHHSVGDPKVSKQILARFEREAKLAARIEHANVVNIYDYGLLGDEQSVPFIIMEKLSGHDLSAHLEQSGAMPATIALPLFVSCLEGLGKAHEAGIVHKDLKPANLFVSNPGERDESLRIVDFGIAHIRDAAEGRLTQTGQMLGTPQYFAPEYLEAQRVSPALDVYQMALVLVETLTGHAVVQRDNPLLCMKAHSCGELDIPTALLDSPLGPILRKALHVDDTRRFKNAYAFADSLRKVDPFTVPMVTAESAVSRLSEIDGLDSSQMVGRAHTDPNGTAGAAGPHTGANFDLAHAATVAAAPATAPGPNEPTDTVAPTSNRSITIPVVIALVTMMLICGGAAAIAALLTNPSGPGESSGPTASSEETSKETSAKQARPTSKETSAEQARPTSAREERGHEKEPRETAKKRRRAEKRRAKERRREEKRREKAEELQERMQEKFEDFFDD